MASEDMKVMEPETENNNVKVEEKSHSEEKDIVGDQGGNVIMMILKGNLFAIKRVMEDYFLRFGCCGGKLEKTRTYQVWPGKNVFFFPGRLVCGPDPRGLILTTVSILVSDWVFSVYIGEDLPNHSTLIVTFSFILTIIVSIVLVNLVLVSAIDPGIIPRNEKDLVDCTPGMRRKRFITNVNGVEMNLKYCRKCKIFRPPRSCHCIVCDNCVERFDHHCPWIGQCIALRNYRFYLSFVVWALAFFIYILGFSCWRIHQTVQRIRGNSSSSLLAMLLRNCPETLALASFSFAASFFLSGLVIFHAYLISINQTAYENFQECYMNRKNPYDKGVLNNFKGILFMKLPSSKVDFRSELASSLHPVAASHEV
nr:probable protein S-acyltransferase 6 [Ziziphus jujuba var. spinosa]